jgi:hypothetical protein
VPEKREVVAQQLRELAEDLKGLRDALVQDPKEQARKERAWRILYGASTAVFAIASRQVAARAWGVLTGERPPGKR